MGRPQKHIQSCTYPHTYTHNLTHSLMYTQSHIYSTYTHVYTIYAYTLYLHTCILTLPVTHPHPLGPHRPLSQALLTAGVLVSQKQTKEQLGGTCSSVLRPTGSASGEPEGLADTATVLGGQLCSDPQIRSVAPGPGQVSIKQGQQLRDLQPPQRPQDRFLRTDPGRPDAPGTTCVPGTD